MKNWIEDYLKKHKAALEALRSEEIAPLIEIFRKAKEEDRQIFVFGNGGSASNCSHMATDIGKGASDKQSKRFRIISLNENLSWITALGNDYAYEDIYVRQLMNYAKPGDVAFTMSVSGSSPNCVKAMQWAKDNGVTTIALVGQKRGKLAEISDHVVVIEDGHYGRAEDMQMTIAHLICYAFIENVV